MNTEQARTALGRTKMLYKEDRITYDFGKFKMIQRFDGAIRNGVIKMDMRNDEEKQLSKKISDLLHASELKFSPGWNFFTLHEHFNPRCKLEYFNPGWNQKPHLQYIYTPWFVNQTHC